MSQTAVKVGPKTEEQLERRNLKIAFGVSLGLYMFVGTIWIFIEGIQRSILNHRPHETEGAEPGGQAGPNTTMAPWEVEHNRSSIVLIDEGSGDDVDDGLKDLFGKVLPQESEDNPVKECGLRPSDWPSNDNEIAGRLFGGRSLQKGMSPWTVRIRFHEEGTGTIIGDKWVLTAAHVPVMENGKHDGFNEWLASLLPDENKKGIVTYGSNHWSKGAKTIKVKRCFVYQQYFRGDGIGTPGDDIAVCETKGTFELDKTNSWPVCLPADMKELPKIGEKCEATAWGYATEDKDGTRHQPWEIQGKKVAIQAYTDKGYIQFEQGVCSGDSGGPLSCTRKRSGKDRQVQYGVISTGGGCGVEWSAGAHVARHMKWIRGITGIKGV